MAFDTQARDKQPSPLHCKASSTRQFLNRRIQKKGNWKCTFRGKNHIHVPLNGLRRFERRSFTLHSTFR
eukprot:Awhi_evm1s2803